MKTLGKIPNSYPEFLQSVELAEYIGVVLGDGNISSFPRTERILIFSNSNNLGFIERYALITEKLFNKKPYVYKVKSENCIRISLYQKEISSRLGVPCGSRKDKIIELPEWVLSDGQNIIGILKGLFEAEGSYSVHKPTCTHNFAFKNKNESLLEFVYGSLLGLGFHPEKRLDCVRLRRKTEVEVFRDIIKFRQYNFHWGIR